MVQCGREIMNCSLFILVVYLRSLESIRHCSLRGARSVAEDSMVEALQEQPSSYAGHEVEI